MLSFCDVLSGEFWKLKLLILILNFGIIEHNWKFYINKNMSLFDKVTGFFVKHAHNFTS